MKRRKKPRGDPPLPNELDQMWWIGGKNIVVWVWDHKVGWLEMCGRPWANIELCITVPKSTKRGSRGVSLHWGQHSNVPKVINEAIAARDAKYEKMIEKPEKRVAEAKIKMVKSSSLKRRSAT